MKIKWVCPVCSSTNVCEKTDHMQCFVCGEYYKEEPHTIERHAEEFSESSTPKYSIKEKIASFWAKIKSSFVSEERDTPRRTIVDWVFEHSPRDSKEAYIDASPVYDESEDSIFRELPPAVEERDFSERIEETDFSEHVEESEPIVTVPRELSEDIEPWPEHGLIFNYSKLRATGCVAIQRQDVHGSKCYKLTYRNGSEKILTLSNMKIMGYLVERSSEHDAEASSTDIHSFIPWPEHRVVINIDKLVATGCVNIDRTEISGNKCYKLTYRNGMERVMNISNMKMMGFVSEL